MDYLVCRDVLIMIDALSSGGEAGEILTFDKTQLKAFFPGMRLSAHQPCLQETLHTDETAGIDLKEIVLVGVVGNSFDVGTELGPYVSRAMPEVLELVVGLVKKHNVAVTKRLQARPANEWWQPEAAVRA